MKTLVIHPIDPTTEFLSEVYKGKDWTVIHEVKPDDFIQQIKDHDRIIMMGHGTPAGLLGFGGYGQPGGFCIHDGIVPFLKGKDQNVYIWCNADQFVQRNNLKGFYTGMIISEIPEAHWFKIYPTLDEVDESNQLFTEAITKSIESDDMLKESKSIYFMKEFNPVIQYNESRLYYR